jgi:hypothetical protein
MGGGLATRRGSWRSLSTTPMTSLQHLRVHQAVARPDDNPTVARQPHGVHAARSTSSPSRRGGRLVGAAGTGSAAGRPVGRPAVGATGEERHRRAPHGPVARSQTQAPIDASVRMIDTHTPHQRRLSILFALSSQALAA